MDCKNCLNTLDTPFNYCPQCGAKVIENRLSFKILLAAILDRFFDLDNTFIRTFLHLFKKPEKVIDGYLQGLRKQYLNPLSYLGIALTLSGIVLFVMRKVAHKIDWDVYNQGVNPQLMQKLSETIFDFSSFIFILYIPIFALAGWLTINKKEYYLSEYIIVFVYALAHWTITLFPISLIVLLAAPNWYLHMAFPLFLYILIYAIFCMQRIHKLKPAQLLFRGAIFCMLVLFGYMGIIVFFYAILFATGTISLQDFDPTI